MAFVPDLRQGQDKRQITSWSGWGPAQFPRTREVTGWNWDSHLEGYLANRPQRFACACGDSFDTPTGFHRCACGKQWNSYVIGTGGSNREAAAEKYLVREIPVRENVIVANRKMATDRPSDDPFGYEKMKATPGYQPLDTRQKYIDHSNAEGLPMVPDWQLDAWYPKESAIYKLDEPGELQEGEEDGLPTIVTPPKDWHRRDRNQRWTKSELG